MAYNWTDHRIHVLRTYYPTEGGAGVAQRLGGDATQNAVRVKARRLHISFIPQPGSRGTNFLNMTPEMLERRAAKLREVNAAKARERAYAKQSTAGQAEASRIPNTLARSARKAEPPPKVAMPIAMLPIPPASTCQWPLTNGRPWSFCGNGSTTGSSYCHAHKRASTINLRADAPVAQAAE